MAIHAGIRVRHWREIRNLTQSELAERAHMDPSRLCRIELGKAKAKADEIERIAGILELSMPRFYGAMVEVA